MSNSVPISYPVMEHFYTLQGEGVYAGHAAYFIRLGGCDVGCVWCDVKESWSADAHPHYTLAQIKSWLNASAAPIVVVTGGEPTLYNLAPLTQAIHECGKRTHIETSGTNLLTGNWDWITVSPKKFKAALPEVLAVANELKVIAFHMSDFKWAQSFESSIPSVCRKLIQPEWDKREKMLDYCIDFVKQNPTWHLSLQTHKYINIP